MLTKAVCFTFSILFWDYRLNKKNRRSSTEQELIIEDFREEKLVSAVKSNTGTVGNWSSEFGWELHINSVSKTSSFH